MFCQLLHISQGQLRHAHRSAAPFAEKWKEVLWFQGAFWYLLADMISKLLSLEDLNLRINEI